jgi:hypothetical protein
MSGPWFASNVEWLIQRKDNWNELLPKLLNTFYSGCSKKKIQNLQNYYLYGQTDGKTPSQQESGLTGWDKVILHPELDASLLRQFIGEGPGVTEERPRVADFLQWYIEGASNSVFCSLSGCCNGREQLVMSALIDTKFNVERWMADGAIHYSNATHAYFPPVEVCEKFVHYGRQFLIEYAANPWSPVQYMIDYWKDSLQYLDSDFVRDYDPISRDVNAFLVLIRYFYEPRNEGQEVSSARRFRDRVFQILESGTGNAFIDSCWKNTEREIGPTSIGMQRTFFSDFENPTGLRTIVQGWSDCLGLNHQFDIEQLERVDIGNILWWGFAQKLGYPLDTNRTYGSYDVYGAPLPAYRYRLYESARQENGLLFTVCLHILAIIQPEHSAFDSTLPQFLVLPQPLVGDADDRGDFLAVLREREVARHIENGSKLKGAVQGFVMASDITEGLRPHGSENLWYLKSYIENPTDDDLCQPIAVWPDSEKERHFKLHFDLRNSRDNHL